MEQMNPVQYKPEQNSSNRPVSFRRISGAEMTPSSSTSDPSAPEPLDFDRLWNFADPAATEQKFREFLPRVAAESRSRELELLTQIARTLGLQRKFDAAHQLLNEVEAEALTASPLVQQRYLLERGRVFNSSGQPEQSRPLFLAAWELSRQGGDDYFAVDAAHMLGIIEPPSEQLAWNLKALAIAEAASAPGARRWLGSLYNNIGWTYHALGQNETALAIFEKAVAWREAAGQAEELRIARWCVARILRALDRVEEALALQRQLADELAATQASDGYVL
ncbi:MAG: tetratricopeptide repeat protein, partial [Planctomycetaceae bacterium]|nr:tetratricopeptide repeat protein [Planctomycetaceae bacterium]